jgi:hypothetical protein
MRASCWRWTCSSPVCSINSGAHPASICGSDAVGWQRPQHWAWGLIAGFALGVVPGLVLLRAFGEGGALAWLLIVVGSGLFGWVRSDGVDAAAEDGENE